MQITINGKPKTLPDHLTVTQMLEECGYAGKLVAVARNGDFVSRSTYNEIALRNDDEIEIVSPMQGG